MILPHPGPSADAIGNIPSYSYLEDKAFRHGDIEDIIANLAKASGGGFLGRSLKFTSLDVKRVYFVSCHPCDKTTLQGKRRRSS